MKRIITLTMNPAVDRNTQVDRVVDERKLRCDRPTQEPGGGGINVSRAIKQLGGESRVYYTGGGPTADILHMLLEEQGLRHHLLEIRDWTRENLHVYETSTDRQYRFGMPGPVLEEEEWKRCLELLSQIEEPPDYVVASGSLPPGVPPDFYARVGQIVNGFGARYVLDTSGEALKYGIEGKPFLIKPNLGELRVLTGGKFGLEREQVASAQDLIKSGKCEVVVISIGASGALLVSADLIEHVRSPTVPIKSRVGAGDSMVAGMVLMLAQEKSLDEVLRFGVAAGAAAVMNPGTELCRKEDTERLYREIQSADTGRLPGYTA